MNDLKFQLSFDERGRVIYQPGDIVGVRGGKGPLTWLSYHAIVPHTPLFHFLLIRDRRGSEDYEVLESIGKGVAVGRLSWYQKQEYVVFRPNHENADVMGRLAADLASKFGRRKYDWKLYLKIFAWALGYWTKEVFTGHIPPRPVTPAQIPYRTDHDLICVELVFEAWKNVGFKIRAYGHAPVPAEVILAGDRGDIQVIDSHDGNLANWREHKSPLYTAAMQIVEKAESKPRGDVIGRQGGHNKTRNRTHIFRQPFGYPIRLCDWTMQELDSIERIGEAQGTDGPAAKEALVLALDWAEREKKAVICKHCLATVKGERGPIMGEPSHDS